MNRAIRFLLEVLAGVLLAGLLLGATIPLVQEYVEGLPRPLIHGLVFVLLAGCVMATTLRPGGSLRG